MIYRLISYRDNKLEMFTQPFMVDNSLSYENIAENVRRGILNGAKEQAMKFGDFQLFDIGNFDDECGLVVPLPIPKLICNIIELKGVKEWFNAINKENEEKLKAIAANIPVKEVKDDA